MVLWLMRSMRVPTTIQNLFIEVGPLAAFFIVYYVAGFMSAVVAIMCTTLLSVAAAYFLQGRVPWFPIFGALSLSLFGTATLLLDNPDFFIIQDTVQFVVFAAILFASLRTRRTFLEFLFGGVFALTTRGWRTLTVRWASLFVVLAAANELVRMFASDEVWVLYKALSSAGVLLFGCWQFRLSARERLLGVSNALGLRTRAGAAESKDI